MFVLYALLNYLSDNDETLVSSTEYTRERSWPNKSIYFLLYIATHAGYS